jgi:phospholipase C
MPPITHLVVLMLENRSYDHLFGRLALSAPHDGIAADAWITDPLQAGDPAAPWKLPLQMNPPFQISPDPPHEYQNVVEQLCGPGRDIHDGIPSSFTLMGFPDSYYQYLVSYAAKKQLNWSPADLHARMGNIFSSFAPAQIPVLSALAAQYLVCDRWFSSLPGPTWPNRYFVHAASSGGLYSSPSNLDAGLASTVDGLSFPGNTISDALSGSHVPWRVYFGDLPQVLSMKGMNIAMLADGRLKKLDGDQANLAADLQDPRYPYTYTFIEPAYDVSGGYAGGNSMHPEGDIRAGEQLVLRVYNALRNSPLWQTSMLVILFDEHGGFCDHAIPPAPAWVHPEEVQPNLTLNTRPDPAGGGNPAALPFDWSTLGLRVPALVISPWLAPGVCHTLFDHSSIPATIEALAGLGAMTARDQDAQDSARHLLALPFLAAPRTDCPVLADGLALAVPATAAAAGAGAGDDALMAAHGTLSSFVHLSARIEAQAVDASLVAATHAKAAAITTVGDAKSYIGRLTSLVDDLHRQAQQAP